VSRNLTRRERAAGKVKHAPPPPKPTGAHKPKRLPWTDAEVAAMQAAAKETRERLAATCEAEGHVLRRRTPWESVCDRCRHVERPAENKAPPGAKRRSRTTTALVAMALSMGAMGGIAGLPPERHR